MEATRVPIARLLLLFTATLLLLAVRPVQSSCPTTAVNCSFGASDSCSKAYRMYDDHGLKWTTRSGAISQTYNIRQHGYYRTTTVTHLHASPKGGDYVYVPATSDPRAVGLWTEMVSPPLTVYKDGCLYFFFHNNVCDDGTNGTESTKINFRVSLSSDSPDSDDKLLRSYPCIADNQWYTARIPIHEPAAIYRLVFAARQHAGENDTMAVDHVIYTDQACSIRDQPNFEPGDCDFEDPDLCGYLMEIDPNSTLHWRPVQKEMMEARHRRDNTPDGIFMALWGKDTQQPWSTNKIAVHLKSPQMTIQTKACLSFTYYSGRYRRDNDNLTALVVSTEHPANDSLNALLLEVPATLGTEWIHAYVPLYAGTYSVRFSALVVPPYGHGEHDVMALDDVEVHQEKTCEDVRCDRPLCEDSAVQHCNGRGTCVGRGLKHKKCACQTAFLGNNCEYSQDGLSSASTQSAGGRSNNRQNQRYIG